MRTSTALREEVFASLKSVDVTEKDIKKLLKGLEEVSPRAATWQNEFGNRPEMVVKSVLVRRRARQQFKGRPSCTERLNAPIQTTGTDILKSALAKLAR
ncbi:MAG: hypothetical protein JOZ19_05580 [Rubrobacter sp.]|nr:hypothetical protein [Rubrobacter sp.]